MANRFQLNDLKSDAATSVLDFRHRETGRMHSCYSANLYRVVEKVGAVELLPSMRNWISCPYYKRDKRTEDRRFATIIRKLLLQDRVIDNV